MVVGFNLHMYIGDAHVFIFFAVTDYYKLGALKAQTIFLVNSVYSQLHFFLLLYWSVVTVQYYMSHVYNIIHNFHEVILLL